MDLNWIEAVVDLVRNGVIDKAEKDGITIYRCGKIIRIDIKGDVK